MVKNFKLVTGEELTAKVVVEDENTVTIKQPFVLMIAGEGRMAVVPWLPLSQNQEFVLNKRDVLITYEPVSTLVDHYNQQTGSIVTAPAGVLKDLDDWRK